MAGVSSFAHSLSIWLGMLSGQTALLMLMFRKSLSTPSSVTVIVSTEFSQLEGRFWAVSSETGVKTDTNCFKRISAFPLHSTTSEPLLSKSEDTPILSHFFDFMKVQKGFVLLFSRPSKIWVLT